MTRSARTKLLVGVLLTWAATACGGGGTEPPPPDTSRNLSKQGGDNQQAAAGAAVATAPAVRVTNGSGAGVSGVSITFAVASGGGSVTGASQTTDAQGNASVGGWTLGTVPGANTLTATIAGTSTAVTFTATATAAPAATIEKTAGDNQTATVRTAVAVAPAVRVVDAFGNPVSGATVTFLVTGGGGSVTGGTATTSAAGVATAGGWTLGPTNGPNALTASVQGSQAAAVVFTATGQEVLVQPAQDTTFQAGTLSLTRLVIPAGRTVTVAGNLVINADSAVVIAGTLTGDCVAITLNGEQTLQVSGTINNACTSAAATPQNLKLVAKGGYTFTGATPVVTSGDGEVTNDPTLTDADFPAAPPAPVAAIRAAATLTHVPCHVQQPFRVANTAGGGDAAAGADGGPLGGTGRSGRGWTLQCRGGDLELGAGAMVEGQNAGRGGNANDTGDPAQATAGKGGTGGNIKVRSTGKVIATAAVTIRSGNGGAGGAAIATGTAGTNGQKAANAKATGGDGGPPGLIEVRGNQGIGGASFFNLEIGDAGSGGPATANGADGQAGKAPAASSREQDGGDADAEAGDGADTPDKQAFKSGTVKDGDPTVSGGAAGNGGAAVAAAGVGAAGTQQKPDGGDGGALRAVGGDGGDARTLDIDGLVFGMGGNGGIANFLKARAGNGWDNCGNAIQLAGNGGKGGNATGRDGTGGTGGTGMDGAPGGVTYANNSNGGDGGDHLVAPGTGGAAGTKTVTENGAVTNVNPNFTPGVDGQLCPQLIGVNQTDLMVEHIVFVSPCPQLMGVVRITNTSDVDITISRVVVGTSLVSLVGGQGVTLSPGQFVDVTVQFNCLQAASFTGTLQITATPVPSTAPGLAALIDPQVVDVNLVGEVKIRAVRLAQALGGFTANSLIQQSRVTNWLFFAAHPPNCTSDHLHSSTVGGILIDGLGPFPDPDATACGYGPVELATLPPLTGPQAGPPRPYPAKPED